MRDEDSFVSGYLIVSERVRRLAVLFATVYLCRIRQTLPALQIVLVNSAAVLRKLHLVLG